MASRLANPRVAPRLGLSAVPAIDIRVAPNLDASALHRPIKFRVAPSLYAFAPPLMSARVAPPPHLRLYQRWIVESPRFSHPSAVPVVKASGCPSALRLRYRRRSVSRLPRILHLPAPADSLPRVTPVHAPSGFAIVGSPGFPESPSLARRWTNFLSFPKNLGPSASPVDSSPSCPGFSSSGSSSMLPQVAPRSHRRLVDDESPAESNFASSACAADESSRPIGSRHLPV